jgi:hypothetical protein
MIGIKAEAGPIVICSTEIVATADARIARLVHTNSAELPSLVYFAAAQELGAFKPDYETCEAQQGVGKGPRPRR